MNDAANDKLISDYFSDYSSRGYSRSDAIRIAMRARIVSAIIPDRSAALKDALRDFDAHCAKL